MADSEQTGSTSPQAVWPDPARVKRHTELAREPTTDKPVSDYFPGIDPADPSYELARKLLKDHPHAIQALSIVLRSAEPTRINRSPLPISAEAAGATRTRKLGSAQSPGVPSKQTRTLFEMAQQQNVMRHATATATAALAHAAPTPDVIDTLIQQTQAARSVAEQRSKAASGVLAQQARARAAAQNNWSEQFGQDGIISKLVQIGLVLLAGQQAMAKAQRAVIAETKAQEAAQVAEKASLAVQQAVERTDPVGRQALEKAKDLGLLTSAEHAAATAYSIPRSLTIADYGRVSVRTEMASGAIITALARPPLVGPVVSARESMENTRRLFEALDRVESVWAEDGLWFVFSRLTHTSVFLFEKLTQREQVEAAALDALEQVCQQGLFIEVLCSALVKAPHLTPYQRDILTHGLEHVQRGEYRPAISNLITGLEGALCQTAIDRSVIDSERWIPGQPKIKKNRLHSVDAIIKRMPLDRGYARFLHGFVFGKHGNSVRHGNVQGGERERALMIVVALVGWMDDVMQLPATKTLATAMSGYLPEAVSRQRQIVA
jgi:hypothetical protein